MVALSGGKDSLAMLELLAQRSKIFNPRFTVEAVHVMMENIPYRTDTDFLEEVCRRNGVRLTLCRSGFDRSTDSRKSPCFLCSWNRRKALFTAAQELGCNKIALGHQMDDFLVTLLMNMTFQGAFSAMTPKMVMRKFHMTVIRPLCLVHESDLKEWARIQGYKEQLAKCPYENESNRYRMKEVLAELEAMNPEARYNLWGSMTNVQRDLLPPLPPESEK